MNIAIAVCTHNRRALLEQTLAHLAHLEVPSSVFLEALVVTNACTDGSAAAVAGWRGAFPLHHRDEPTAGLSHARNRALDMARELKADFLVWCDDDVLLEPDFLAGYIEAFQASPGVPVFGGRVLPHFLPPTPDWMPRVIEAVGLNPFSCLDLGPEPRAVSGVELPFGANMAVRMAAVGNLRFDPSFGVTPARKLGFEETHFLRELLQGAPWQYVPASTLRHVLPPSRQSLRAVAQYHRAIGHYHGLMATRNSTRTRTLLGAPRWAIRLLITLLCRAAFARLRHRDRFASLREDREIHRTLGLIEAFGRHEAPEMRDLIR